MRKYLEFTAGTRVLMLSFAGVLAMMLLVNGELIDLKMSYTLTDVQAAMAQYGPDGRADLLGAVYESMVVFLALFLWRRSRRTNRLD